MIVQSNEHPSYLYTAFSAVQQPGNHWETPWFAALPQSPARANTKHLEYILPTRRFNPPDQIGGGRPLF